MQISPKDSFEIAFNAACGLLEAGDLPAAEQQLQLALRVGELVLQCLLGNYAIEWVCTWRAESSSCSWRCAWVSWHLALACSQTFQRA